MGSCNVSPRQIRRIILEQAKRADVGHIGSALSIADIIAVLYRDILRVSQPEDNDRDRFVLSKGHAALAVYAALFLRGWITEAELNTYCADGGLLGVHPDRTLRGIDFCTGSLGQGLSMGAGAALAARLQESERNVYVLVSDAECNEGSLWEAVMFAAHNRLSNLTAIVDVNGQQALDYTHKVLNMSPMSKRWRGFDWVVHEVDGHSPSQLTRTLADLPTDLGAPHVVLARTVSGKGVSYMEGQVKWHYWPMSDEEYQRALAEVGETSS